MCYDIKASLEAQLKRARHYGNEQAIEEIIEKLLPYSDLPSYHVSGFSHPRLFIYPDKTPYQPILAYWGLIPSWIKDRSQVKKYWNNTLNARGETIFEKPSFRDAAKKNRCLFIIDGFYEHHHYKGKTFPFYVSRRDNVPMSLAGLWSEWIDKSTGEVVTTFTIITTEANPLLRKIHNNPKLKGPRMPVILSGEAAENWLKPLNEQEDSTKLKDLLKPYPVEVLKAHTVQRLRGRNYPGNIKSITEEVEYKELDF
ncbi:SOS response-associated peptidase [Eudoraea chungangensis]|uniref:SOS response-associated peptidase n=1 Tax=Eudoraea chungangensis TaxID=1481905 RepID=UPI0023EA9387|nr:SOS response-associated peptidase [Eudoraea chungangensis]